eukprot:TRINITY_DN3091_c0_g3_i3.p1 TRINITY_DN3091_c0_g3~~TRINITY_DN3091_c0_g3_i3.p1  ORF type:complete len:370 (-),score=100.76 TRINITY_DN3091_c0_g3_i3:134-1243(-)
MDPKPYLGGYRDKRNGIIYHHATTQTYSKRKSKNVERYHRDTQTKVLKETTSQTLRQFGTQTIQPNLCIEETNDKVMIPKMNVMSLEEYDNLEKEYSISIQRCLRGFLGRTEAKAIKLLLEEEKNNFEMMVQQEKVDAEEERQREISRRLHPQTASDFKLLHAELERWRETETAKINALNLSDEERKQQMKSMLAQETKYIQRIEGLRIEAKKKNKDAAVGRALELMAAPKVWGLSDGNAMAVETPFTKRADELKTLFELLEAKLELKDRLDVLLHVKWTVKQFDCELTRSIVNLIDREADLLQRGRPESSMKGLRSRLLNLFLNFVKTPQFNPEAVRFQKVPREFDTNKDTYPIPPPRTVLEQQNRDQ